ncbi:MAG: acetyl-CoA acetyltransferase [Gammaproteobacteria bacterium]|jgi:acetyl-CoA C-acetyltransferase|nr:acetyl-CoA acetyltransferase [Gammaproteobacteria bacterium]
MNKQNQLTGRPVYIIDGARTPFLKAMGKPGPFSSADLGTQACRELLLRQTFDAADIDEVITGSAVTSPDETNIGRIIALRSGCAENTPAWTVQRNCASGMQALDSGIKDIALGRCDLVLAGGTDAMSRGPILYNDAMVNWLAQLARSKSFVAKLQTFLALRPQMFKPVIGLLRGLTDPVCGLTMGQTAEIIAYDFGITREMMDAFSVQSHQRLAKAQQENHLNEIVPVYDTKGNAYLTDTGLRADSSIEKLAKLKPAYDKPYGTVTAGNSSQVTDGAAFVILASEDAVQKHQLKPIAKIVDVNWGALNPAVMGLGPVYATVPLLMRNKLQLSDIDYFEINEAFAGQVLACLAALNDANFCKTHFGLDQAAGILPQDRLNIDGGAIALGHPIGATGARLVLHLAQTLKRQNARRGIATLCIGGGQGGAMLIEAV